MTRKFRDAFQLDNIYSVGSEVKSRRDSPQNTRVATVYAIAEKGSELILEDHLRSVIKLGV
jgi:hypothetical protein